MCFGRHLPCLTFAHISCCADLCTLPLLFSFHLCHCCFSVCFVWRCCCRVLKTRTICWIGGVCFDACLPNRTLIAWHVMKYISILIDSCAICLSQLQLLSVVHGARNRSKPLLLVDMRLFCGSACCLRRSSLKWALYNRLVEIESEWLGAMPECLERLRFTFCLADSLIGFGSGALRAESEGLGQLAATKKWTSSTKN